MPYKNLKWVYTYKTGVSISTNHLANKHLKLLDEIKCHILPIYKFLWSIKEDKYFTTDIVCLFISKCWHFSWLISFKKWGIWKQSRKLLGLFYLHNTKVLLKINRYRYIDTNSVLKFERCWTKLLHLLLLSSNKAGAQSFPELVQSLSQYLWCTNALLSLFLKKEKSCK